jgi:hypothetical protein
LVQQKEEGRLQLVSLEWPHLPYLTVILGTKVMSRILTTLQGREPAIKRLINQFNKCVDTMEQLHRVDYNQYVTVPSKLPTNLTVLRTQMDDLQLDVWPNPDGPPPPKYVTNPTFRKAVNGLLRLERCNEEQLRLQLEAKNLLRWLPHYRSALLIALGRLHSG